MGRVLKNIIGKLQRSFIFNYLYFWPNFKHVLSVIILGIKILDKRWSMKTFFSLANIPWFIFIIITETQYKNKTHNYVYSLSILVEDYCTYFKYIFGLETLHKWTEPKEHQVLFYFIMYWSLKHEIDSGVLHIINTNVAHQKIHVNPVYIH